ncbi:dienelactone hydrolase family protein [Micropruina sonneratiae]|uniref:dienelactone hydrolase family protein n=1 Tax=Micropruina sonneratiae TaxID=2986940 RepID=UPI0022275235|nr:dienelactone hydrolase family protein [Micropruina sp. KQZ13P-5]MCW3158353.1 dienelactone hydrolase family protein [Micropruina sp. KQZ13P-5]
MGRVSDLIHVMRPDGNLPVHRWLPPSGGGPGLLVLQEIFGVSDYIRQRCADLADAGYVVYAPELYFRLGAMTFDPDSASYVQEGMGAAQQLDWEQTTADASATLDALRAASEVTGRVGIVGFCFGGGLGFQVAARNTPDALVAYYGSAIPGLLALAPNVTCPSLHHWGEADSFFPPAVVEKVRAAVTPHGAEFHTYAGAEHAFDNPGPMFHHPAASGLAWSRTLDFLARMLAG